MNDMEECTKLIKSMKADLNFLDVCVNPFLIKITTLILRQESKNDQNFVLTEVEI